MKRMLLAALSVLSLNLLLTGCDKAPPADNPVPVSSSAPSAVSASGNAPTPATVTSPDALQAQAATAEQITETGGSESSDNSSAESLSLRIAPVKPEPASQWQEGTHYLRLVPAQTTSAAPGQIEVTEMFWYGCPHCYALDPVLENWRKNAKPSYVTFVRVPVMWGTVHRLHARLYYTAELLGKLEQLHTPIFQEINLKHVPLDNADAIKSFFTSHGVSAADFDKSFASFTVEASLKRADALGLRYRVESVPLIIINGKYVTDVGKTGGQQQLIDLINELTRREHER